MNTFEYLFRTIVLFGLISTSGLFVTGLSQPITIHAEPSATELIAGEELEVTLSIQDQADVYFFSVEVEFDNSRFEYTGIESTDLTTGGLAVADLISPGIIGASVTRTEDLSAPSDGGLMILKFLVKEFTPVGEGAFSFDNIQFADSEAEPIDFENPEDTDVDILESIVTLELTTPHAFDVTEGDEYLATGQIYATGITTDEVNTTRTDVWIGVNDGDTDPAGWDAENWQLMEFVEQSDEDFFTYSGEIAWERPTGTYYVALRAEVDESGEYSFGGVNGFWNDTTNSSAEMEILLQPPYRYTIAGWDFDDEVLTPGQAIFPNQNVEPEVIGASFNGFTSNAANSNGWHEFVEGQNYWQIVINTEDLEELRLSSSHDGSGTGPRDFQLEWSLDGTTWDEVNGGLIEVGNSSLDELDQLTLPAGLENQTEAYLRWVQTDSLRVDQNEEVEGPETVSAGGTNRIDDILITGINPGAGRVDVWPGDTDDSGEVDEEDILPLGFYWLSNGPPAIYPSITWEPRESEEWITSEATYADANGDGRVDQNDLQPVGLHFGESIGEGGEGDYQTAPLSQLELDAESSGNHTTFYIVADEHIDLSGISFRIDVLGLAEDDWSVYSIEPIEWGEEWAEQNRLIDFRVRLPQTIAASMVHKGAVEPEVSQNLVGITLQADRTWEKRPVVRLLRSKITANEQIKPLTGVRLASQMAVSVEPPVTERPEQTRLLPNYPNPFNPATTIPFTLSEPGDVQVEIFDALGRQVVVLKKQTLQPGSHSFQFDASSLSRGLYLYRLQANGVIQTRKMTLLK